jgi:hypothetical protein
MDPRHAHEVGHDLTEHTKVNPWPIKPLTPKDLSFTVKNYDFTGLTAGALAPTQGLLNTIDAAAAEFSTSIADQTVLIASMAGDLDDLGIVLKEMSTDDFEQVAADLAKIAAAGDSLLSNFTGLF